MEEFLRVLHENIPVRGLSQPVARSNNPLLISMTDLFKGVKRDIIDILVLLIHLNKHVQNIVRDMDGIQLLLSQTNIDDDNPCMYLLL